MCIVWDRIYYSSTLFFDFVSVVVNTSFGNLTEPSLHVRTLLYHIMIHEKEDTKSQEGDGNMLYPRTGKRGVPQQFPRRLYHMLETESEQTSDENRLITWSPSGTAFLIEDSVLFSSVILPKYFKTNVFSSFQRNMNLYGFSKLRKGPEAGMYHHPDFVRGKPDNLYKLTKCKTASDRKHSLESKHHSTSDGTDRNMMIHSSHMQNFSHGSTGPGGHVPTQSQYGSNNVNVVPERSAAAAQFAARANANAGHFKNPHMPPDQAYLFHMQQNRMPYHAAYAQPYSRPSQFGGPFFPPVPMPTHGGNIPTSAVPLPHPFTPHQGNHPYPPNFQYPVNHYIGNSTAQHNQSSSVTSSENADQDGKNLQGSKMEGGVKGNTSNVNDETARNEDSEDSSKMKGLLTLAMTCLSDEKK